MPVNWRAVTAGGGSNGYFEAVLENQDRDIRPLSEIINPAGPIGFACNYAIYYLKSNAALVNLNSAISQLRSHYVLHRVNITPSENNQGNAQVIQLAFKHVTYQDFELELKTMDNTTKLVMRSSAGESAREFTADNLGKPFDSFAGILGLRLMIDSETGTMPSPGDKWFVNIETTEFLEDPELRQLKWDKALPPIDSEAGLFTETVLAEMAEHLPEVADRLRAEAIGQGLPEDTQLSWAELSNETRVFIRGQYHRYLLIRRYTRMFPVDSNNLLLDLELGKTPALEEFKRLHRYVDVLKAVEEQQRLDLENERREKLLEEERLGDPDIEKVTVIGTASELEPVVNVDINEED